jgi:TRAP-type transport system small permease protein
LKRLINNFEEIIGGIFLVIVIVSVNYGVISRYVLKSSAPWANEVATAAFVWVVFIGGVSAFKKNMHIGIDLLVRKLGRIGLFLSVLSNFLILIFAIYATYLSINISISAWDKPTSVLRVPYTYIDMGAVLGFALISIHQFKNILQNIRKGIRK